MTCLQTLFVTVRGVRRNVFAYSTNSWQIRLRGICAIVLAGAAGCGGTSDVPVGEPAENVRKLALGYVQFAAQNRGEGPSDKQAFLKFIAERNQMTEEEAEKFFISPRDNQPYVIRWGLRPEGSRPIGPDPPKPLIIIYESTGSDGTRCVADGRMSVLKMSEDEFSKAVPPP